MLLHCSSQFFCVLHSPLVFPPVSATFLLCFPQFSCVLCSSPFFIVLYCSLYKIIHHLSTKATSQFLLLGNFLQKQTCSNYDCRSCFVGIYLIISSFSIISLYDNLTISHFQLLERIVGMHFTSDCSLFTRVPLPPAPT